MNIEYRLTSLYVGIIYRYLAVKASRTEKRRVKNVGTVGSRHDDYPLMRAEAVHLDQQLVERLFSFVVSAAKARSTVASDSVDLIYKYYGCRSFARRLEQVAHTRRTDADVHFNEVRAGDREERHIRLAGNCLCKQGLTGTGRAHQQYAVRYLCAETCKLLRVLEELDDLLKLLLLLVRPRNVLECHLVLFVGVGGGLDPRLAEAVHLAALARHLIHGVEPHGGKYHYKHHIRQQSHPPRPRGVRLVFIIFNDPALILVKNKLAEILAEIIDVLKPVGNDLSVRELHCDNVALGHLKLGHLLIFEVGNDSGVGSLVAARLREQPRNGKYDQAYNHEIK